MEDSGTDYFAEKDCRCCCSCDALKCMYRPLTCTCNYNVLQSMTLDDGSLNTNNGYKRWAGEESDNLKAYLYKNWGSNGCQLLYGHLIEAKLLEHLHLNVTTFFLITRVLFIWALAGLFLGIAFTAVSFYTISDNVNPAVPICQENYSAYYMCPLCDDHCDFWYLKQAISSKLCTRHFRLVFDNPVVWVYCSLVIIGAFIANAIMIKKALRLKKKSNFKTQLQKIGNHVEKDCFLIFSQYSWMVIYILFIVALYFGFVLFSLYLEDKVRQFTIRKYNGSTFLVFILATVPSALIQTCINNFFKVKYRLGLVYLYGAKDPQDYSRKKSMRKFVTTLIPNMFISYLPIVYRIIFFGNVVSDPTEGYRHIAGRIRFHHCPTYGCIDVGAFVFFGILGKAVSAFFNFLNLAFPVKVSCNKKDKPEGRGDSDTSRRRFKPDTVDHYVDLIICYGYTILFITATGALPTLATAIALPMAARHLASYYLISGPKERHKCYIGFEWKTAFLFMTVLAVFSNISIIISNSRFVQHVSYSSCISGHSGIFLNFDGYLGKVFPKHNLTTLVKIDIFPSYDAQKLPMLTQNGQKIRNKAGDALLYLPFINFTCLKEQYNSVGNNFTKKQYMEFMKTHFSNNSIIQYSTTQPLKCFDMTATCRSRGFLRYTEESECLKKTKLIFMSSFIVPLVLTVVLTISCSITIYRKCKHSPQVEQQRSDMFMDIVQS